MKHPLLLMFGLAGSGVTCCALGAESIGVVQIYAVVVVLATWLVVVLVSDVADDINQVQR
jgi:hypothetical protein